MAKANQRSKVVPLAERRGLQGPFEHDLSFFILMVRADIERVTDLFAEEMKAKHVRKAVPRAGLPDCEVFGSAYFPFQGRGHAWTTVVHQLDSEGIYRPALARRLSERLKTRAIFAGSQDTAGTIDYILYDSGKLAEVFHWGDLVKFRLLNPAEFERAQQEGFLIQPYGYYAASRVRTLPVGEFEALFTKKGEKFTQHVEYLIDGFLRSQDAFLALNWLDEPGTEYFPLAEAGEEDIIQIDMVQV
jgi:hypothetical protein